MANQHIRTGDAHLQDDDHNWFPERTMPQGTQENGVDFEHEERDVNLRAVINWFAGLGAGVLVIIVLLYGAFQLLLNREPTAEELPSPIFAQQQVPPNPRLIPNPFDSVPGKPLLGPIEYGQEYKEREDRILSGLGLHNLDEGVPSLPQEAASVLQELNKGSQPAPEAGRPVENYPSDMSGGTEVEDRLR